MGLSESFIHYLSFYFHGMGYFFMVVIVVCIVLIPIVAARFYITDKYVKSVYKPVNSDDIPKSVISFADRHKENVYDNRMHVVQGYRTGYKFYKNYAISYDGKGGYSVYIK